MEEETHGKCFPETHWPRQRARIEAEIAEETKIKTELASAHARSERAGADGSMEGFIAARTS